MVSPANRGLVYSFGIFEVFVESRELFRQGRRIKMQDQPFELLLLLLEHHGETVDREVIRLRLWPKDTFVDFGQSLGTAITKLRQALGDDANNPIFVETIPRRGYRFIAPVAIQSQPPKPEHPETNSAQGHTPADASGDHVQAIFSKLTKVRGIGLLSATIALLAVGVFAVYLHQQRSVFALAAKDTVVLADFENTTGDAIFNDTLREALIVGLAQSPIIHVLPDRTSAVVFKQMGHSPDDRMTGLTAIDLCKRVGGKVTVQGSISSLGTTYLIGLAAIRCDSGKPIAHEQAEAPQKSDVIDALGKATSRLRERLGESMPTIQKYNAPLEQATTSSLEALNAYGLALSTWDAKGDLASIPYFKKAIELDPQFAMAYGALAAVYNNSGKAQLARENTIKAYTLRERVTDSERASIEARYYLYVTEEVDKAAMTYAALAQDYPESAGSLNHLGTTDLRLGRNEQAVGDFRKALLVDPNRAITYGNLGLALLRLNRLQETQSVLAEADRRGLRTGYWLRVNYWLAFLNGNQAEMDRSVLQASDFPGARPALLSESANTEAVYGHVKKSLTLSLSAADQMERAGDKESAARILAQAAVLEAQLGFTDKARSLSQRAQSLSSDKVIVISSALVSAETGEYSRASSLTAGLDKQYPNGTFVQHFWLPLIRGELELRQGRGTKAVELLSAGEPLDPSVADGFAISPLYPAYELGEAYLVAGDGAKAGNQFRSLIEQRGMVLNSTLAPLAHLGQARAFAQAGHPAEAREAYEEFFKIWKDADPGIPLLRKAHAEADRLKTSP
jgi:DNA-binding winged helix-turn-helix (wHTH) protein/Tfp pilus assembly protein PilF